MYRYTPAYHAKDAGPNIRKFMKDHQDAFWSILKPLLPFIIGGALLDLAVNALLLHKDMPFQSPVGGIIGAYFITAMVISWHRLVIHGPDNFVPMNPLKPKKNEIKFMAMGIGLTVAVFIIMALIGGISALIHPALLIISILIMIPVLIFVGYRVIFYFPAMATDSPITLKQSFALSKGYIWKLLVAGFYASWRLILVLVAYQFFIGIIFGTIGLLGGNMDLYQILIFLLSLPILIYFNPLLTMIGVTALSNYYQHALQNQSGPTDG